VQRAFAVLEGAATAGIPVMLEEEARTLEPMDPLLKD
jgi:uncharacterized protein YbaR (Trm112 family)